MKLDTHKEAQKPLPIGKSTYTITHSPVQEGRNPNDIPVKSWRVIYFLVSLVHHKISYVIINIKEITIFLEVKHIDTYRYFITMESLWGSNINHPRR